jgi:endonuclease
VKTKHQERLALKLNDKSTKELMHDFAKEMLKPGQVFTKKDAIKWFTAHYPNIKPVTVGLHVGGMAVNAQVRRSNPNIQPNKGWDLFYKIADGQFRLWDKDKDPPPKYQKDFLTPTIVDDPQESEENNDDEGVTGSPEFAYEQHLQQYLVKNLSSIEAGLHLYEDEGLTGVEYPVGGRYIDILALDAQGNYVVIELKVSRGYDRTIGQLLRYMGWIKKNLADGKNVRGIIVASDITEDLRLAASQLQDVKLLEYEISFSLKPV